jgi:citrate lyase gamma subunit
MTIKDVMVRLDGTSGDDARLAAASQIAEIFGSHITGLFFNVLSRDGFDGADAKALHAARKAGDATENMLFQRLKQLQQSTRLRRFDVASEAILPMLRCLWRAPATPSWRFDRTAEPTNRKTLLKTCSTAPGAICFWFPTTGRA